MAKVIDFEKHRKEKGYQKLEKDLDRYLPALALNSFLKEEDRNAAVEGAKTLLSQIGVASEDIDPLYSSLNGLETLAKNFLEKYGDVLGTARLRDLRALYSDSFEKFYTPENIKIINSLFSSDKTYGELMGEYASAGEIVQSKTSNFSDKQKEEAKEKIQKLNPIVLPLTRFGELKLKGLEDKIKAKSLGGELNSAHEEKPDDYRYALAA